MVNQKYLESQGFVKDHKCPDSVNRWEKEIKDGAILECWVSVTLTDAGDETLYGVLNMYNLNLTGATRPYIYISEHRKFDGPISGEDFDLFLDRHFDWGNRPLDNR